MTILCRILGHSWRLDFPRDAWACERCGMLYARAFKRNPPLYLRDMPTEDKARGDA